LPELVIAKESKLKGCCADDLVEARQLRARAISAIFGNFGSSGNKEKGWFL
jgi:hypothetical protein